MGTIKQLSNKSCCCLLEGCRLFDFSLGHPEHKWFFLFNGSGFELLNICVSSTLCHLVIVSTEVSLWTVWIILFLLLNFCSFLALFPSVLALCCSCSCPFFFFFFKVFFWPFYDFIDSTVEDMTGNREREGGSDTQQRDPGTWDTRSTNWAKWRPSSSPFLLKSIFN